jgi:hypothetical protein
VCRYKERTKNKTLTTDRARDGSACVTLPQVQPVSPDVDAALHAWRDKTPALAAIKGAAAAGSGTKGTAAGAKKGGAKDDPKAAKGKKK